MDTEAHTTSPIQRIVREETDDGRLIVRFLVAAMQDQIRGAKPHHRLDAARQLIKLGFEEAKEFASLPTPSAMRAEPAEASQADTLDTTGLNPDLARFIRAETDGGRQAIRFLIDVMLGFMPGFGPHHRIDAAKELLRRGFDDAPGPLHHDTYADAELNPLPQSAGEGRDGVPPSDTELQPLPQSAGEGRDGVPPSADTNGAVEEPQSAIGPLPQSAGEGRDGVPPSPDANGAVEEPQSSLSPLPQSAGEGRDGAPDILAGYEPPYSNTYGHSEDTGFDNRAVSKATDALLDAVGKRPTPPGPSVVYPSKRGSIIIHNGEEHYFSEHARPAVERSIAAGEIIDAVRRIRDSCRGPIRIACPHGAASCDLCAEPTDDEPEPSDLFPSLLGKNEMGSSAAEHPAGEPDPGDNIPP